MCYSFTCRCSKLEDGYLPVFHSVYIAVSCGIRSVGCWMCSHSTDVIYIRFNMQGISTLQKKLPAMWNNDHRCIKLLFANPTAGFSVIH